MDQLSQVVDGLPIHHQHLSVHYLLIPDVHVMCQHLRPAGGVGKEVTVLASTILRVNSETLQIVKGGPETQSGMSVKKFKFTRLLLGFC